MRPARPLLSPATRRFMVPLSVSPDPSSAPPGWRWILLTKLARLESGHTPSRRRAEWWGGPIPWLALPDIRALDGIVAYDTAEHTNQEGIANSSARVLPPGTVALSRTASVGFVTILGKPMATSQDFVCWICGPDLASSFLALLLRASRHYIRSLASGAVHKTVYVPTVESFHVCVPSLVEQKRLAAEVTAQLEQAERIIAAAKVQAECVAAFRDAVLRSVFATEQAGTWARVALRELLRSPLRTGISKPALSSSSVRCLTLSSVRQGLLDPEATKPVNVTEEEAQRNSIQPGAFYVVRGNGNRALVGRGGLAPRTLAARILYPDLLIEVDFDSTRIDAEFLSYAWDGGEVRADIERRARTAAGIYKINQRNLAAVRLPLPALSEQKRLAALLRQRMSGVQRLRDSVDDCLSLARALPASLLQRAFTEASYGR